MDTNMKVDWKKISQSKGYKSLKADYLKDIQSSLNTTSRRKEFKWIIGRATHYAYHKGTTLDVILDEWEALRTIHWGSFYYEQNKMFKKLNLSDTVKRQGFKGYKKSVRKGRWYSLKSKNNQIFHELMRLQRINSKRYKIKKRWEDWKREVAKIRRTRRAKQSP